MFRKFLLLAIRSSVAYRLSQGPDRRGTPPASTRGPLTPAHA